MACTALGSGCGRSLLDEFVVDRALDPCVQSIPACPNLFASCALDVTRFARVRFPTESPFRFLVDAEAGDTIEVGMFFAQKVSAGESTDIFWYEPGCSNVFIYESEGRNLFDEAEGIDSISRTASIERDGEHLVEIFSDMQADVIVAVTVHEVL